MKDIEEKIHLLEELISCRPNLFFWSFDGECTPIHTNCPVGALYRHLLGLNEQSFRILRKLAPNAMPVVMTNQPGLLWIADFLWNEENELKRIYCIGPIFMEDVRPAAIEDALKKIDLFGDEKRSLRETLYGLPILSSTRFYDYGLMLHYCITGEKISYSDYQYPESAQPRKKEASSSSTQDLHGTWAMEQELLRFIEEGNLDYKRYHPRIVSAGDVGRLGNGDPVRGLKNQIIIFTALCTRAAIKGGLTPEIAYTMSDKYISAVETSSTFGEVAEVNDAMQDDFIKRVHQCKLAGGLSPQVKNCMNYLQVHFTEKISVPELCAKMGYSASHFTKLFKQETGQTIHEYLISLKIEQAKDDLRLTGEPVRSICARLGFESQSYFGKQFKSATGMTPVEYRERQGVALGMS